MIEFFDALRGLTITSLALRFFLACLFGGIIGLERGRRQQAAGLRTHMMVCLGAASTMIVGEYMILVQGNPGDILRLGAQVVSGIGFLGAGTIIVTRQNGIRGLTTASSLWASACMGIVIGSGFYECAIIMMLAMVFILMILSNFDINYVKVLGNASIYLELEEDCDFSIIVHNIKQQGWNIQEIRNLDFLKSEFLTLRIDVMADEKIRKPNLSLEQLKSYEKIHYVERL